MQDNRSDSSASLLDPDQLAGVVLGMLIEAYPGLRSVDELTRLFAGASGDAAAAQSCVRDGLNDLVAHGLVHQLEGFVFVSQSAVRAEALRASA